MGFYRDEQREPDLQANRNARIEEAIEHMKWALRYIFLAIFMKVVAIIFIIKGRIGLAVALWGLSIVTILISIVFRLKADKADPDY